MWTERQWRDRRIGVREIFWSWTIVAVIALGVVAWDGIRALLPAPSVPDVQTSLRVDR